VNIQHPPEEEIEHACFFSLEMKTTKRSDPSAFAIPSLHNFLQSKYTFSSLQINIQKIIKKILQCITIFNITKMKKIYPEGNHPTSYEDETINKLTKSMNSPQMLMDTTPKLKPYTSLRKNDMGKLVSVKSNKRLFHPITKMYYKIMRHTR